MSEFDRPEITVTTMGKVANPSGKGIKIQPLTNGRATKKQVVPETYETKVKDEGNSRRNIVRKKSDYEAKHKKQGGSGKGKWSEYINDAIDDDDGMRNLDKNDPLYDEFEDGALDSSYVLSSAVDVNAPTPNGFDPVAERVVFGPMLTLPEFKIRVTELLREYLESSGDAEEFILNVKEMKCREFHSEVVKRVVSLSCDEGPRERELASRLLSCMHHTLLTDDDVQAGFDHLLDSIDDLEIDIPDAKGMIGAFIARCVVDEVLPPAFLSSKSFQEDSALDHAVKLLSREHCTARLEKIWGPGDGRPVEELKVAMDQLLKEYLLSRELDEAARCVRELNSPLYHHELVKRGVHIAMEDDGAQDKKEGLKHHTDSSIDAMSAMFAFLVNNAILSETQVRKGLTRLKKTHLDDIKLDVPGAPALLQEFEKLAKARGCLMEDNNDENGGL